MAIVKVKSTLTKRRSFACFLWSQMWKEKKFYKATEGIMNIPEN